MKKKLRFFLHPNIQDVQKGIRSIIDSFIRSLFLPPGGQIFQRTRAKENDSSRPKTRERERGGESLGRGNRAAGFGLRRGDV